MKKNIGITLLLAFNLQLSAQQSTLAQKLDEYLLSLAVAHQFNGTVLVAVKGQIVLQKGYGWKNAAANSFNDANTIFQIGSGTKPFTATVILKLQEQGKLSVQDKISTYLPAYPGGDRITIENLLTNTSGVPGYNVEETDTIAWTPVSKELILGLFENSPLEFTPGSTYKYSNAGYFLLGMIIEKVTGESYEQAVRNMIFAPLQMTHSGFDFINSKDSLKATGYAKMNDTEQRPAHLIDSSVSYSAGAMYSTTGDLFKWVSSFTNNKLLSADDWKKAFTPYKENYGDGFFIDSINGENYIGHPGGIMGFGSYFTYFPKKEVTIILLSNLFDETNLITLPVQELSAIVFNKPYSLYQQKQTLAINDTVFNQYTGTYALSGNPRRTMMIAKENNQPVTIIYGQATLHMVFQTDTKFLFKELPGAAGEFIVAAGKPTKMLISQNGLFEWIKIK